MSNRLIAAAVSVEMYVQFGYDVVQVAKGEVARAYRLKVPLRDFRSRLPEVVAVIGDDLHLDDADRVGLEMGIRSQMDCPKKDAPSEETALVSVDELDLALMDVVVLATGQKMRA